MWSSRHLATAVQSKAAPRCRRVRVQHESTRIRIGEPWPGRTCRSRASRWGDGPASQARHHGRPANSSVHTRNSTKRRTALSNQAHTMAQRPGEQGSRREARVPQGVPESSSAGGRRRTAHLNRPRKPEVDREGNSFRNARRKDTTNGEPLGWLPSDARNWL